jgi:hypothetical protein
MVLATTASGCTTTSSGEPHPARGNGSQPESPARPRDIRLDDVDPCALVPASDYPEFSLDQPGKPDEGDEDPKCLWMGETGYFSTGLIMSEGVEALFEDRHGEAADTDPVEGFPAYTVTLPDDDNACFVAVDVADGQYLLVQVGLDHAPAENQPSVCDTAHRFAASAMGSLVDGP